MDNIFENDYFDMAIEAHDATALKRGLANISPPVAIVYEMIHKAHIKKSVVVDVDQMIANGLPKDMAYKNARKAIKFFEAKGYLQYKVDASRGKLYYNDLNGDGKLFIQGFYDKMDRITPFTLEKAVHAKRMGESVSSGKVGFIISFISAIATCIAMPFSPTLLVLVCMWIRWGEAYGLMIKYSEDLAARNKFDNEYIEESVDDNMYDEACEDAFDDNYFEAM